MGSASGAAPGQGSVVVRLGSPGFLARPPVIEPVGLVPDHVRQASGAWQQARFPPRDVLVRQLDDVLVAAEGLVFDGDGRLVPYSVREHEPELVAAAQEEVSRIVRGSTCPRFGDMPLVLGKKRGAGNFGHWLIEILPGVDLILRRVGGGSVGVLVHDVTDPRLGQVMQDSLRRIGVADRQVRVSGMAPVRVGRLLMVEELTEHGSYMSPLVAECHERLAQGSPPASSPERVLLMRPHGATRRPVAPARLAAVARARGFAVIEPAALDFSRQIALMRGARLALGVMGAQMTSMIYARPGARVTLLAPAGMPDTFFWFIAQLRGLAYREIRCRQEGREEGWNGRLDIDEDLLGRVLDEEIAAVTTRSGPPLLDAAPGDI